ncbi:hypothetical protein, partial [Burkholderia sp.]|uniref:hypothetical protein n=1 Tax=Burkholderia sp. TaxID=36773 RepID=UPI00258CEF61
MRGGPSQVTPLRVATCGGRRVRDGPHAVDSSNETRPTQGPGTVPARFNVYPNRQIVDFLSIKSRVRFRRPSPVETGPAARCLGAAHPTQGGEMLVLIGVPIVVIG